MDAYGGITKSAWARSKVTLITMVADATLPLLMKPANLLVGSRIVPQKFLKLWRMMILFLASTANTAVLASLVNNASLALFDMAWAHAVKYAVVFLLPVLLLKGRVQEGN